MNNFPPQQKLQVRKNKKIKLFKIKKSLESNGINISKFTSQVIWNSKWLASSEWNIYTCHMNQSRLVIQSNWRCADVFASYYITNYNNRGIWSVYNIILWPDDRGFVAIHPDHQRLKEDWFLRLSMKHTVAGPDLIHYRHQHNREYPVRMGRWLIR